MKNCTETRAPARPTQRERFKGAAALSVHFRDAEPDELVICKCDQCTPEEKIFASVPYLEKLAASYKALNMSNPGRINWAQDMIQNRRTGRLYDLSGKELDVDGRDYRGEDLFSRLFGGDGRHEMKRLLARGERRFYNVLKNIEPMRTRLVILDHAMRIARCATEGRCAQSQKLPR